MGIAADSGESLENLSDDEIARELASPVSALFSLGNDFVYRTTQGDLPDADNQPYAAYLIEPTIPFQLDNGKRILVRFEIPVIFDEPIYIADQDYADFKIRQFSSTIPTDGVFEDTHDHMGDIAYDVAYGGVNENGLITMYGVAGSLPFGSDTTNSRNQWLLGPEFAIGKSADWGVAGVWLRHLVDVSGNKDEYSTSETSAEVFFAYSLGNGWQVISNPVIKYDWEGGSGNRLFIPLAAGIAKTARIGKMPYRLAFQVEKYIASPDLFGPDWQFTLSFRPVFPARWNR